MTNEELLKTAINCGILSLEDVRSQVEIMERQRSEILKAHPYKIWESKDGKWYTYVADYSKPNNRRLIKKSSRDAIEDYICDGPEVKIVPTTFGAAYKEWREVHDRTLCSNSVVRYETDYARFFEGKSILGRNLATLTKSDIEAFIFESIRDQRLCPSAAKKLYEYMHDTILYALEKDYITRDPMQFLRMRDFTQRCYISERAKKEQTISKSDSEKILEQIQKDHNEKPDYIPSYAVEFAMLTAMRVGEIAALRWSDFSEKGVIIVRCSEKFDRKTGKYYIDDTKNRCERVVPVTDQMRRLLYLVKVHGNGSEFIFGGIHADTISSCMENKCKQAGVMYHGIHACRKTINSNMKRYGASGMMACSILGNTEEVNAKHYSFDVSEIDERRDILEKASMIRG